MPEEKKRKTAEERVAELEARKAEHLKKANQLNARIARAKMTKEDKAAERTHKLCLVAAQLEKLAKAKDKNAPKFASQMVHLIDTLPRDADRETLAGWRATYQAIVDEAKEAKA